MLPLDDPVPVLFPQFCRVKLDEFGEFEKLEQFEEFVESGLSSTARTLSTPRSTDHASVMLPTCSPAVMVTSRVPVPPAPTRHRTAVSDLQPVASHLVDPTRAVEL